MRYLLLLIAASALLMFPAFAHAGMAEAKDLARTNNCAVTSVRLVNQSTDGDSVYEVSCAVPAEASEDERKANSALRIRCSTALCSVLKKGA